MSRPLDPNTVVNAVADWYRVKPVTLSGFKRGQTIARARHVAMYLLRKDGRSLNEIGDIFRRDHVTVLYACNRIHDLRLDNVEFNSDVVEITKHVKDAHNKVA